ICICVVLFVRRLTGSRRSGRTIYHKILHFPLLCIAQNRIHSADKKRPFILEKTVQDNTISMEGLLLFILIFLLILWGFPVAFTMAGISLLFGLIFLDTEIFYLMPSRIMGIINNHVLIAVPLFIFMGLMLEKSGVAERMLEAMTGLFGKVKGGMAISVITVGALLAASTGIVGATVVTMGLISLPTMLKWNYDPRLATGVIASSGTLGQIIPPSIVLILLGSVMNVSVGSLFKAALLPGVLLTIFYVGV